MSDPTTTPAAGLGPSLFPPAAPDPSLPTPYGFLALDIETCDGSPDEAERWMRRCWSPNPTWKPETIGKRFLDALEAKKEKLALLDTAPIVCVSLKSETELRCLHCLQAEEPREIRGGLVEGFASQRDMLVVLRNLLDARCFDETVLVGHNILGFDLRRLRWAFVKHGVRMPYVLRGTEQPAFDTMVQYGRLFSMGDKSMFVSLSDLLDEFGLANHKADIDGSMVPDLVREKRFDELLEYAVLDVVAETELFLRMTGQVEDSKPAPAESAA